VSDTVQLCMKITSAASVAYGPVGQLHSFAPVVATQYAGQSVSPGTCPTCSSVLPIFLLHAFCIRARTGSAYLFCLVQEGRLFGRMAEEEATGGSLCRGCWETA
jgi:hypothetical protein